MKPAEKLLCKTFGRHFQTGWSVCGSAVSTNDGTFRQWAKLEKEGYVVRGEQSVFHQFHLTITDKGRAFVMANPT